MTPEELQARETRMGASDAAAALGLSHWKSAHTLWLEKTGRLEPSRGNQATDLGTRIEPAILDVAESELGPLNRNVLRWAPKVDFPLAALLDSEVCASGVPCEAKTGGLTGPLVGEWGEDGSDILPPVYLVQLTVQMICSEAEFAHLYALLSGRGIVRYRAVRDAELCADVTERLSRWWDVHVNKGIEPTLTEPIPLEVLKRYRRTPDKVIELADDATLAAAEWEAAKATRIAAEKTCEAAQSRLIAMLGDAEGGKLVDGRSLTYMETKRKGYYVNDTTYRTLRIKK